MKTIEQLEQAYQKEISLSEKHKRNASDIRKQIELQQGKMITQKINSLNMSGAEYDRFIKLLGSGKKSLMAAAEYAMAERTEKGDGQTEAQEKG